MTELRDFDLADLAGYLLARQMKPSDTTRLHRLLLNRTTEAIAGLDLGLSRSSNRPPKNSILLKQTFHDGSETFHDEQNDSNKKRPNRAGFALSRSRSPIVS